MNQKQENNINIAETPGILQPEQDIIEDNCPQGCDAQVKEICTLQDNGYHITLGSTCINALVLSEQAIEILNIMKSNKQERKRANYTG
jgi:hypothetical protein